MRDCTSPAHSRCVQPRPFPQDEAGGAGELQNYTITDLFLEAGVQEICFLFADTLCFYCQKKNHFETFQQCSLALLPDLSRLRMFKLSKS